MIEYEPAMVGVRGSFMLKDIEQLMQDHPPARERFVRLRDAVGIEGVTATAISDWLDLTLTLGEEERALDWFDRNVAVIDARPELARTMRSRLVGPLITRGRWVDVARLFPDPVATLREGHARLERTKRQEMPEAMDAARPRIIESFERMLRRDAGIMFASLVSAGRESEARAVAAEVRRVCPGPETEKQLLETARKVGVSDP
jgi:hypothetical protein